MGSNIKDRIRSVLFENEMSQNPFLQLHKEPITDEQLKEYLNMRPGEVNIILARTVEFLNEDHPGKTKRQVITEILEVLARSPVARKFVGSGLRDNYKLFKGFPVRRGDPLSNLPDPGTDIQLTPNDAFISWSVDANTARGIGTKYDPTKGDPIGGLLVLTNVDSSKIMFDVNAVINAVKAKKNIIDNYNISAAPGKSISKTNTNFLATKAPVYNGPYEVIIPSKYKAARVEDKWTWEQEGQSKKVKWKQSDIKEPSQKDETQPPSENDEPKKEVQKEDECQYTLMNTLFESYNLEMDEGILDFIRKGKDFVSRRTAHNVRGKSLKYLDTVIKQYKAYQTALEYAKKFVKAQEDQNSIFTIDSQLQEVQRFINDARALLIQLESSENAELNFLASGNNQ